MLTFMRNKLVGVERPDPETLVARGVLDDDVYSLQVELTVESAGMTITGLSGRWNRYTTPDCPLALEYLPQAIGLCLNDHDFSAEIHKRLGRKACRHFANLVLECCDSMQKALILEDQPEAGAQAEAETQVTESPVQEPAAAPAPAQTSPRETPEYQALLDAPQGFFIDLHVHTWPASACASDPVDQIIAEAKDIGLDAICLTDHNHLWDADQVEELRQKHGFLILRGNEITTAQGDMVVFGLERDPQGIITLEDLHQMVVSEGGFIIAAHPFRGFLTVGVDELGLPVEKASQRPMFKLVQALEALNSKVTEKENRFSAQVAQALNLPATGGSDAHLSAEVGIYATRFEKVIHNERELIAALQSGRFQPAPFRNQEEK
ncbi:MAG: PHP domain-containing protein [Desulfarculaceae bacterium]|jgi:predicted metal-dependent phosphoesterase TrpH